MTPLAICAKREPRGPHRRAIASTNLRLNLVRAIARTLRDRAIRAEHVRLRLGESEGSLGSLRRELAGIKAHRTTLGFERLLVQCEALGVDATAALCGAPAERRLAS